MLDATLEHVSVPDGRKRRKRATIAAAALAVLLAVGVVVAVKVVPDKWDSPQSEDPPVDVEAELDGTYRLDFDLAERTVNGTASPLTQAKSVTWTIRSTCTVTTGCAASASSLDDEATWTLHYVNSSWEAVPTRTQVGVDQCVAGPGAQTELQSWTMHPQEDGSLRGEQTATVLTAECGSEGRTTRTPFVATRIADAPDDVAVRDPADAPGPDPQALEVAGPKLAGTYRFDGEGVSPRWLAFRSLCTESGCVAVGVELDGDDHQQATQDVDVLRLVGDRWELRTPQVGEWATWWMVPQADGTLQGVRTGVGEHPFVATREGTSPADVVIADPADFQ